MRWRTLALALCLAQAAYAQTDQSLPPTLSSDTQEQAVDRAAALYPIQNGDVPLAQLADELDEPSTHLLDLNRVTEVELLAVPGLSAVGARAVLVHRARCGPFADRLELNAVQGLPTEEARMLSAYILPQLPLPDRDALGLLKRLGANRAAYLLLTTGRKSYPGAGYSVPAFAGAGGFAGDAWHHTVRFRNAMPGDFSVGVLADKDPGEAIAFGRRQYGADYISAHIVLYNRGRRQAWRALAVGDYSVLLGQGLLLGQGYAIGRGADPVLGTARVGGGIAPYTSLLEGYGLRGAAATRRILPNLELTLFASAKEVDASRLPGPATDSTAQDSAGAAAIAAQGGFAQDVYGPISYTGLHRTRSELARRQAVQEYTAGAALQYSSAPLGLSVGLAAVGSRFGAVIGERGAGAYAQPLWAGDRFGGATGFYTKALGPAYLFGEAARSVGGPGSHAGGGWALLQGLQARLGVGTDVAALYRNYAPGYTSLYGHGFAAGARTANERGLYLACAQRLGGGWALAGFADMWENPAPSHAMPLPGQGREWMARLSWQSAKNAPPVTAALYVREEQRLRKPPTAANEGPAGPEADILQTTRRYVGGHIRLQPVPALTLMTDVQTSLYQPVGLAAATGFAAYQEARLRVGPASLHLRWYLFDTQGYNARLYAVEYGGQAQTSLASLYGQGTRWMGLLRYNAGRWGDLWLRCARMAYAGPPTQAHGSGPTAWQGNAQTELTVQARIWVNR